MRNKYVAAILAFFFGIFGVHRFYLGQTVLGIIYLFFFWTGIPAIVGLIDAILLLVKDERQFDYQYNREFQRANQDYPSNQNRKNDPYIPPVIPNTKESALKAEGIKKFKDYDYKGAIEDFKKALEASPKDISLHFNLACAYSLIEQTELGFKHLYNAVQLGFKDYDKIKTHEALSFLRIQDEWVPFEESNFSILPEIKANSTPSEPYLDLTGKNLLDQLKQLTELKERGLLNQSDFDREKKKLLG